MTLFEGQPSPTHRPTGMSKREDRFSGALSHVPTTSKSGPRSRMVKLGIASKLE